MEIVYCKNIDESKKFCHMLEQQGFKRPGWNDKHFDNFGDHSWEIRIFTDDKTIHCSWADPRDCYDMDVGIFLAKHNIVRFLEVE